MLSLFKAQKASAATGAWPKASIVGVLKGRYANVSHLKDEDGFSLYGVNDNGLNFIVALVEVEGAADQVTEVGFLTRFAGFDVHQHDVDHINRNLHLSVAGLEGGELFVVGGVMAAGAFDATSFALILDAWKRDLMIVIQALQGGMSVLGAFPAGRSEAARQFAVNKAPEQASSAQGEASSTQGGSPVAPVNLFKTYFGDGATKALCAACDGRGKQGFIARTCSDCDGAGLVASSQPRF